MTASAITVPNPSRAFFAPSKTRPGIAPTAAQIDANAPSENGSDVVRVRCSLNRVTASTATILTLDGSADASTQLRRSPAATDDAGCRNRYPLGETQKSCCHSEPYAGFSGL